MWFRFFLFMLLPTLVAPARAELLASPHVELREARLRLLGEVTPEGRFSGGLEIRLAEGFKTYWKNAGDSGVPPQFDFSASSNLSDIRVGFPFPRTFDDGAGGTAYGYLSTVILPIEAKASPDATLRLRLDFAVCGKLCIPLAAELALEPGKATPAGPQALTELAAARQSLPRPLGKEGVSLSRSPDGGFRITLPYAGEAAQLKAFPDAPGFFEVKSVSPLGAGQVELRLVGQPAPGKTTLGPLSLTYGTPEASFERIIDVDGKN